MGGGSWDLKNWYHTNPVSLRIQNAFGAPAIMLFAFIFGLVVLVGFTETYLTCPW